MRYDERVILSEKVTRYFSLHVYCEMSIKDLGFESSYGLVKIESRVAKTKTSPLRRS